MESSSEANGVDVPSHAAIDDLEALNSSLVQLKAAQELHLLEHTQLIVVLDALDKIMQQGEALLIQQDAQVSPYAWWFLVRMHDNTMLASMFAYPYML